MKGIIPGYTRGFYEKDARYQGPSSEPDERIPDYSPGISKKDTSNRRPLEG
jgi:hypothetical protein